MVRYRYMYILTVIPIQKGPQREHLTYFSSSNIPLGSIVTVPIRLKVIDAIVLDIEEARNIKSEIKGKDYQLKKVISVKGHSPFTESFFIACERMKNYNVSNTGTIIKSMLPSLLLDNINLLEKSTKKEREQFHENIKHEKLIFQSPTGDRIAFYRTLIREAFAKKESIFICVPTHYDINQYESELAKGIEQYVYTFHGGLAKKALISKYNTVIKNPHPILIIGTGIFLSIPRSDIKTIVIEHESSDSYKQLGRPYVDIRSFAEVLSSVDKIKLIFGDTILRPETLSRHDDDELGEIASPIFRLPQAERQMIIDMKEETNKKGEKTFKVLSETTIKMISYAEEHGESVFLFSTRKGLAPVTVCHDCGNTLLCPACQTPVVLYGAKQRTATKIASTRIFMCNKCGRKETTETRCAKCQSWNLNPLGIGTDRVHEELKELFPKAEILQMDKENVSGDAEAKEIIKKFNTNPGCILIGTEMAFSYLNEKVTHSAIISLDGLLSIPSFNITQKILHIIEKLHGITERNVIIQTRISDNQILKHILSGNVLPLYREDLNERKLYGYPPFKRLIKIAFTGSPAETEKARSYIDKVLGGYDPQIFSAFVGKVKGQYVTNTVIKVDPEIWPLPTNEKTIIKNHLKESLSLLPPSFSINVDPEDLL